MRRTQYKEHKELFKVIFITSVGIFILSLLFFTLKFPITTPTGFVFNVTTQAKANIINWSMGNCSFIFHSGWNLVSFPCIVREDVSTIMQPIDGKYESIFTYDAASGQWWAYNPDLPSYVVQDLKEIDSKHGYWINMKQTSNYSFEGAYAQYTTIQLHPGWNLIGYPSFDTKNVSNIFNNNITEIWRFNSSNKNWYYYKSPTDHTFTLMLPYFGYWVRSNTSTKITITSS